METNGDSLSVEPMRLTGSEAYVYEAIATLEYLGRPVTRAEIEVVAEQASPEVTGRILRGLSDQRLIEERGEAESRHEPAYRLAPGARAIALPDDDPGGVS
ncbi:MAG: hypothetical protein J2P25_03010 [Nocardiopsaceae bacterium]|nr:hypothetical protein [Nocardiopsaceae bacterium]